ncbi:MAG: hypothetical protein JXR83_20695, partial [Deltaproteobacteria bacterium]|nr:hypothetical protein [Deltaproteobacteria bacterium]
MNISNWKTRLQVGALAALVVTAVGCPPPEDDEDAGGGDAGVQHDAAGTDAAGNDAAGSDAGGACLPQYQYTNWDVTSDRLLVKACSPYIIEGRVTVGDNATLTIEPGVEVRLAANNWIAVGTSTAGKLVAIGTASDPIVFTSSESQPSAGSWVGLVLGAQTLATTALDHVVVRYGGEAYYTGSNKGCVSINAANAGRISIDHSTFDTCAQAGVAATDEGFAFSSFAGNTFEDCPVGMYLNAQAVGSVAADQTYISTPRNQIEGDEVVQSATWVAQTVPWHVLGRIAVKDSVEAPVLTIEAGSTLQFDADNWLSVGDGAAGGLVLDGDAAAPVVLESAAVQPVAGSWVGLVFGSDTLNGSRVSHSQIRHGGQAYYSGSHHGCISINSSVSGRIAIDHTTLESCALSGVAAIDSGFAFNAFATNTFVHCPAGMWLNATAVGSVAGNQVYTDTARNRIEGDWVEQSATWVAQPVPWNVDGRIEVRNDTNLPVLTINGGSTLQFAADHWLSVGAAAGGLVIAGDAAHPVVLQSSEAAATPGSWVGVVFEDGTLAGSRIDHAVVRHAGQAYYSGSHFGCVSINTPNPGRIAIADSTFEDCAQAGVGALETGFAFAEFTANTFDSDPVGIRINATAIGSIAAGQTYQT